MQPIPPGTERRTGPGSWRSLHATAQRLLAARFVRSIAQGALVTDLALYLHALHWSGFAIGAVLSGAGLTAAVLSIVIGSASDRMRRKPFLIQNELLTALCGLALLAATHAWLIAVAIVVGGFGRGLSGAAGPFAPAEQAWLARLIPVEERGWVYSFNNALGFFGMGGGALTAMLVAFWLHSGSPHSEYAFLFVVVVAGALINMVLLAGAKEGEPDASTAKVFSPQRVRRWENRLLWRLMQLNVLNGLSMGLIGPLISYWFALRFHADAGQIAPVMAVAFMITALAALYAGKLGQEIGLVEAVVWTRGASVVLLLLLPVSPWFGLAAVLYVLRLAMGGASVGVRQAQLVSLMRDERRGLAASLNAASFQMPQAAGPGISGPLIASGYFVAPFYMAALLQLVYVVGYERLFRRFRPPG